MNLWVNEDWTRPKYGQLHRYYHNHDHIDRMLCELEAWRDKLTDDEYWALKDAIEFHDVIWYPDRQDNEERSIAYARHAGVIYGGKGDVVEGLILATKAPFAPKTDLERLMLFIDWSHFMSPPSKLHGYNQSIFREYQKHPYHLYAEKRDEFLEGARRVPGKMFCERFIPSDFVHRLIDGIDASLALSRQHRPRIGIFVGSFNPFHDGHYATVKQAERFYDKVILVQATSASKAGNGEPTGFPPFLERYYETYRFDDGRSMKDILEAVTTPAITDYTIIRGIRNGFDLTAEQTYMRILRDMSVFTPVHHLLSDAEFQHISSSAVRELRKLGHELYTRVWDLNAEDVTFD